MRIGALALHLTTRGMSQADAAEVQSVPLAVLPIKLLDTSDEPVDQSRQHPYLAPRPERALNQPAKAL